mmetsp:Transcript_38253/g.97778  ORF Transcript_38253/g.97778 Transcript_38253/m.97778 type:complete len:212 (-) Transcript_38253:378-1013(-)
MRKHFVDAVGIQHRSLFPVQHGRPQDGLHKVYPRLARHDMPWLQRLRDGVAAAVHVVDVEAQEMAQSMWHEQFVHLHVQQGVHAPLCEVHVKEVLRQQRPALHGDVRPRRPRANLLQRELLDGQHCVVNIRHLCSEAAAGWGRSRDVGGVASELGSGVHQHDIVGHDVAVVPRVVEGGGVPACADDGRVAHVPQAGAHGGAQEHRLQLVLE